MDKEEMSLINAERCQKCKKIYFSLWMASHSVWVKVTGKKSGKGLYCLNCFDKIARSRGINLFWKPHISDFKPIYKVTQQSKKG